MPPANPSGLVGPKAGAAVVTPSAADVSVLYGWILNCVQGADGGAYATSYYGGATVPPEASAATPPATIARRTTIQGQRQRQRFGQR